MQNRKPSATQKLNARIRNRMGGAVLAYGAADRTDYRLMLRLTQWRGSSLQQGSPIAKQLAGWDFSTRVTP